MNTLTDNALRMYVDLLIRMLTNTVYEDASLHPAVPGAFQATLRATGQDWPSVAHTMAGVARLRNLADLTARTLDEGIRGDYIETGVWRGGCCILMRGILAARGVNDRRVFAADSFAGLPPPRPDLFPEDEGDLHSTFQELVVSLDEVKANFDRYGLLDDRTVFVEGLFSDTLPSLEAGPFALIRLDGDMYESTFLALEHLYPRLSNGGFLIVDDFGAVAGCRKAVEDYRAAKRIAEQIHEIDWTGVWWQKTGR